MLVLALKILDSPVLFISYLFLLPLTSLQLCLPGIVLKVFHLRSSLSPTLPVPEFVFTLYLIDVLQPRAYTCMGSGISTQVMGTHVAVSRSRLWTWLRKSFYSSVAQSSCFGICTLLLLLSFFFFLVHGLHWSAEINEVTGFWDENPSYKVREETETGWSFKLLQFLLWVSYKVLKVTLVARGRTAPLALCDCDWLSLIVWKLQTCMEKH